MDLQLRGLCWLLLFGSMAGHAQQPTPDAADTAAQAAEIDALEPSMGSDDLSDMGSETNVTSRSGNVETSQSEETGPEPAADTGRLAADVRRTTSGNGVMDELDLGRTEITGNQELPKVLYIVPWQKSDPGDLMGRPVNTLLEEVLAPIDRTEFVRQVDYYGDLYKDDEE